MPGKSPTGRAECSAGTLRVLAHPSEVLPPLLDTLRAEKPGLLALLTGKACRRCGGAIADRGPDAWAPFADGTAAHMSCEDAWEQKRLQARAGNALTPEALADEAELCIPGES